MAEETENVKIIPPVEYNDIVTFCNQYDLGLYIIFPTNLNNKYSLPNKFFEFIQSRLAIVTGPSVEMKNYIDRYNLGVAANSFEPDEIADKINNLTNEQIEEFKSNSHKHARELSSETNDILLNKIVTDLLNNNN
jgi:hypothetical protein